MSAVGHRLAGAGWLGLILALAAVQPARAGDWLTTGFLAFGDLYTVPSHHLPEGDGATGLVLRRAYLTLDGDFSDDLDGRLRFEVNQSGEFETYDLEVQIKDLFLRWRWRDQAIVAGLSPTPTFDFIESQWGKRYLMRTPMDLQGIASRDVGVAVSGPVFRSGLDYRLKVGTGADFGGESAEIAKVMLALNWPVSERWTLEFYTDYEGLIEGGDEFTLQGFAGYQAEDWRFGAQYSNQDRGGEPDLELASVYAVKRVGTRTDLIGRVDRVIEPSPKGNNISYIPFDPTAPATLWLAGLEFRVGDHFSWTPNVVYIRYGENDQGTTPESDVLLRLTAFLNFE
ncbi:MAG: hypothetical protein V2I57_09755 [Xanthomonadales bacterium]|jgi:hypothetical protein|nr:hypothetical protein [Xanthomonadales bacterium]